MRFPTIQTRDLEGADRTLPDGLPLGPRVLLLPFQRWHQLLVDGWSRALDPVRAEYRALSVWEVPALSQHYAMGRLFIDGGMRAGIPDLDVRLHTLTAYIDLPALTEALDLPSLDTVYVFLLDTDGEILWRGSGPVDEAGVASLGRALARAGAN